MRLPTRFEKNLGQAEPTVRFIARENRYTLLLGEKGVRMRSVGHAASPLIRFSGASQNARIEPVDPLATKVNDYTGGHRVEGAPCWSSVAYRDLYPGVDLIFYGQEGGLEYDVRVGPGADPARVRFTFDPSMHPALNEKGDLTFTSPAGAIVWHKPVAYQLTGGLRHPVESSFVVQGRRVGFHVDGWDRKEPLIIDPTISFSTFLGGSGNDGVRGIAVDLSGNVYVAGGTASGDLPVTASSYQSAYKATQAFLFGNAFIGGGNAFIAKLNPAGTALAYITYLGGSVADSATSITVDNAGNAYVAGFTDSPDFPVTPGAFQTRLGGAGGDGQYAYPVGDAFIAKFTPSGALSWSTFLGGNGDDGAMAIALDSSGNVFVVGDTASINFPGTAGGYQNHFAGEGGQTQGTTTGYVSFDTGDGFVAKLNPTGSALLGATYLGGSLDDLASTLAFDSQGDVWVGGFTVSRNFPVTSNAFQRTFGGQSPDTIQLIFSWGDGFVSELSSDLSKLFYSTYLGGNLDDVVSAIAVDSSGNIYVAGATQSSNFPVTNGVISGSYNGPAAPPNNRAYLIGDAFVAKFNPGGATLAFSTYLGGNDDDGASALAVDSQGNIFVAGMTNSTNFPTTSDATQAKFGGSGSGLTNGVGDGFLARINSTGTSLLYSSFVGGSSGDALLTLAQDASGNIYTAGLTASPNFPVTTGALQPKLSTQPSGDIDAVISKFSFGSAAPTIGGIVNGASFKTGAISPGETVAIFGSSMGPAAGVGAQIASDGKLSSNVAGVQVLFGSTPAPLVYLSAGQINAMVPYEVAGGSSTALTVSYNGAQSAPVSLQVVQANPALFTSNEAGTGPAAVYNQDSTPNSASNPAAVASVITLFGTGEGQLNPPGVTGSIVPTAGPYPSIAGNLAITIGGVTAATPTYKGSIPGFVEGIFQIDVAVPSGVPSGSQPLVVSVDGVPSPANVSVYIK